MNRCIFIVLSFISLSTFTWAQKPSDNVTLLPETATAQAITYPALPADTTLIINDTFGETLFGFVPIFANFLPRFRTWYPAYTYHRIDKQPIANAFVEKQLDTLVTAEFSKTGRDNSMHFLFYKLGTKQQSEAGLLACSISTADIVLKNGIRIGMKKEDFIKKTGLTGKKWKDVIVISNETHLTYSVFYFSNNILTQIAYASEMD